MQAAFHSQPNNVRLATTGSALSNDTSLSVFTVEGQAMTDGGSMSIDNSHVGENIGNLIIVATPTHPSATVGTKTVTPSPFVEGDHTLEFDVTAEDGVTVQHYNVTVRVLTAGLPEITAVQFNDDVSRSLHNTHFRISNNAERVAVVLDAGALAEVTTFDFTGLTGTDFNTASTGKYVTLQIGGSEIIFWFNTGSESSPLGGSSCREVTIALGDNDTTIASQFDSAVVAEAQGASTTGAVTTVTHAIAGSVADATAGTSSVSVNVTTQGVDAASAVPGFTSIIVSYTENDVGSTLAALVYIACDAQGWSVDPVSDVATFTDAAVGPRTDASNDGGAAASITVTQQGESPA